MIDQRCDAVGNRRQRFAARGIACLAVAMMVAGWSPLATMAGSKKATSKPASKAGVKAKPSLAGFCAASKAWKAYEVSWFANGKPNEAWVLDTRRLMIKLVETAPPAIRSSMLQLGYQLVSQRGNLVNFGKNPGDADTLESVLADAGLDAGNTPSGFLGARDAVGAYALKNCKIDVLQPFRDFAAANG